MDKNNYDIRAIFEKMELELISSMKRAFYFHKREEKKEGFSWEQWQLSKLRAIDKYRKENKRIIDSYSAPIQECIDRELQGNYKKGQNRVTRVINKIRAFLRFNKGDVNVPEDTSEKQKVRDYIAALTGRKPRVPQEESFFGVNEKKLNALQDTVTKDIGKASAAVLRKMDDIYRQVIYKAEINMSAGVKTLNQAIDMATKEFLASGINCVEYKDGKRVNIASYAEMALRTASQRATFLGEGSKRDEWGIYTVVVSAHANTCEKCLPWQGQILIDDVFSHPSKAYLEENKGKYKLVSEAIDGGLLHPNCRHTLTTYFPGITQVPQAQDGEEALSNYKAEQEQRYMERQIRKWKRFREGTLDEDNRAMADSKVKEWESKLQEHLSNNKQLRRDRIREEADIRSIQEINYKSDLKQYKNYKSVLGNESPKTLEEFQNLKYNDSKSWSIKQREYSTINDINNKEWSISYKDKVKQAYYDFRKDNIELSWHGAQRFVDRNVSKNGVVRFTKEDIIKIFNKRPNYIQLDGRLVNFENSIAIIRNGETNEIVSIVCRNNPKEDWRIND